jgi:hypothetical protein
MTKLVNIDSKFLDSLNTFLLDGEPTFTIRAQDKLAVEAVSMYLNAAKESGAHNLGRVKDVLDKIIMWQARNEKRVKLPD